MTIQRTIPANVTTVIDDQHTVPFYIVKIEFDVDGTKYFSEAQEVTFETQTYVEGLIRMGRVTHSSDGRQQASLTIANDANFASTLILGNAIQDTPVSVYLVYSTGPTTNTDPVLYLKGVLNGSEIKPKEAVLGILTSKAMTEMVPNKFHTIEEGFNWLPPVGTVVQWNAEKYVLGGAD